MIVVSEDAAEVVQQLVPLGRELVYPRNEQRPASWLPAGLLSQLQLPTQLFAEAVDSVGLHLWLVGKKRKASHADFTNGCGV